MNTWHVLLILTLSEIERVSEIIYMCCSYISCLSSALHSIQLKERERVTLPAPWRWIFKFLQRQHSCSNSSRWLYFFAIYCDIKEIRAVYWLAHATIVHTILKHWQLSHTFYYYFWSIFIYHITDLYGYTNESEAYTKLKPTEGILKFTFASLSGTDRRTEFLQTFLIFIFYFILFLF